MMTNSMTQTVGAMKSKDAADQIINALNTNLNTNLNTELDAELDILLKKSIAFGIHTFQVLK